MSAVVRTVAPAASPSAVWRPQPSAVGWRLVHIVCCRSGCGNTAAGYVAL